jgi:hypothetical protein
MGGEEKKDEKPLVNRLSILYTGSYRLVCNDNHLVSLLTECNTTLVTNLTSFFLQALVSVSVSSALFPLPDIPTSTLASSHHVT